MLCKGLLFQGQDLVGIGAAIFACRFVAQQYQCGGIVAFGVGQFVGLFAHTGAANIGAGLQIRLGVRLFNDSRVIGVGFIVFFQCGIGLCTFKIGFDVVRVQPDGLGKGGNGFGVVQLGKILPPKLHLLVKVCGAACAGC